MTMKSCRTLAAVSAGITILSGGACYLFKNLPGPVVTALSVAAILFAVITVVIVVAFHRCPKCKRFIPITLRPEHCVHCQAPLN